MPFSVSERMKQIPNSIYRFMLDTIWEVMFSKLHYKKERRATNEIYIIVTQL